jgi:methylenetetrahydrofolate dehydrogenase (NADP+)/methenyltetrahydrofolate cyclohydrolase
MQTLAAKPVAEALQRRTLERVQRIKQLQKRAPRLAVVIVGEDPASQIYVRKKGEMAVALGMEHETIALPKSSTPEEVRGIVQSLNENPAVDGILIQRPLPPSFREEEVVYWVAPEKDVDAFHPENAGRMLLGLPCFQPCTPAGIMEMLKFYGVDPSGKTACVIGRSSIVGKPMAILLTQANATVFHCHSRTPDLPSIASQADILVAAIGKAELIDARYVKQGAVVIDVGMNRRADGKVVGDCDWQQIVTRASMATPVPGGVGPMTIQLLMQNTAWAAERRGLTKA